MPCNCDHLEASQLEIELSRVYCLLDELDGKDGIDPDHWRGYHPKAYNHAMKDELDRHTAELCARIQRFNNINRQSLEMQMWWRDHQKADKERVEAEIAAKKTQKAKDAALAKLTPHERKLLGVQ